jgi:small GTP-binding protein
MKNTGSKLSIAVVHESKIDELIGQFCDFLFLKNLNIPEDNSILWDMNGKDGYCIQAMFIGKTGYGKSTTLNKLCGKDYFQTDAIKSCTKTLFSAEYKIYDRKNYYFSLCDLPGVGESNKVDKQYTKWYAEMLIKSHCLVYVLRADQRDFSVDAQILGPILENAEQKKKVLIVVNYCDKIEPFSRSVPFIPSKEQLANIKTKTTEIQKVFAIPAKSILFYSATEGYNLNKLVQKIAGTLKETVKPKKKGPTYQEKKQMIYEMTSQDNCGVCGCINCMQFAMQAASDKNPMNISDCPYIDVDDADTVTPQKQESYFMAYKIGDDCINCGACEGCCPYEAISEKDDKCWIDPDKCASCGACAGSCPVEAITEG